MEVLKMGRFGGEGGALIEVLRRQEVHALSWPEKVGRYLTPLADIYRIQPNLRIFDLSRFREGFRVDMLCCEIAEWTEQKCQLLDRTYYLMRRPTVGFRNYDPLKQKLFPQGQGEGNSRNADLSEVRIDGSRARRTAGIGATVTHCAGIAWGICMLLTIGLTLFCFTVDFVQMLESYSLTMGFFSQLTAT